MSEQVVQAANGMFLLPHHLTRQREYNLGLSPGLVV